MNRAERRHQTDLVIKHREWLNRDYHSESSKRKGHFFAKRDSTGNCGNKHCSVCLVMRWIKRLDKRRERYSARRETADT